MRLYLNGGLIAHRYAHVAARILYLDGGVRRNLHIQHLLIAVMFGQAKGVEEVVAVAVPMKPGLRMIPPCRANAQDGEQDQDAHKAAAAAHRGFAAQVQSPLAQQGKAGADQHQRPPAAIPAPEIAGANAAAVDQQGNYAYGNQDDRADDGGNARAVCAHVAGLPGMALGLPGIALRAPCGSLLLTVNPPLGFGIVRRNRGRRASARRHVGRYVAHDCPPSESFP